MTTTQPPTVAVKLPETLCSLLHHQNIPRSRTAQHAMALKPRWHVVPQVEYYRGTGGRAAAVPPPPGRRARRVLVPALHPPHTTIQPGKTSPSKLKSTP